MCPPCLLTRFNTAWRVSSATIFSASKSSDFRSAGDLIFFYIHCRVVLGDDESVNITKDQTSSPNLSCKVKHFVNSMPYLNPRINYLYFFFVCLLRAGAYNEFLLRCME